MVFDFPDRINVHRRLSDIGQIKRLPIAIEHHTSKSSHFGTRKPWVLPNQSLAIASRFGQNAFSYVA